jgi:hypothetical protein
MTKYYLWMKQEGEGCDYTCGCGERLVPLNPTSDGYTAVMTAARETLESFGFMLGAIDRQLKACRIVSESNDIMADIARWKTEADAVLNREKALETERQERAELARLANKYGR